jgi:hypothetical protein
MAACVIMHNMIIENEQDLDDHHYELMGHPVQLHRERDCIARFVEGYHAIWDEDTPEDLQKDLMEEWWAWWDDRGVVVIVELCDGLCVLAIEITCDPCKTLKHIIHNVFSSR